MSVRRSISMAAFAAMTNAVLLTSAAHAQWTLTILHPEGAQESVGYGARGAQQLGYVVEDGVSRASLWTGTAVSRLDLHPAGTTASQVFAASGGQQVGYAALGGVRRAVLWSGSATAWVDLSPPGALDAVARAIHGGQQGGDVRLNEAPPRASLWTGTAASRVDLHPLGMEGLELSTVRAVGEGQQGGFAVVLSGGVRSWRAILWSGSADQWVDLTPSTASDAWVSAIDGDEQAGMAWVQWPRAVVWNGSRDSWRDISPPGSVGTSEVYDASGGQQVGIAWMNDRYRASLWSGTSQSWVDLSAFLPAEYTESRANGISTDGVNTYITGFGVRGVGPGRIVEAWLLTRSESMFANGFEE